MFWESSKEEYIFGVQIMHILLSIKLMAVTYTHANQHYYEAKLINCYQFKK